MSGPQESNLTDKLFDQNGKWFVLKGEKNFGPFSYLDLIKMLQEKSLFGFDFVWREGMDSWVRVGECDLFSTHHIRQLYASGSKDVENAFIKRKSNRALYDCPILVHNNERVWKGRSVELSEGGAGIEVRNALLVPGQKIYVHFSEGQGIRSFNVLSEIVSKRYLKDLKSKSAPIVYGVKFINLDKLEREEIKAIKTAA